MLFTTREVLNGEVSALDYVENPPGRIAEGPVRKGGLMEVAEIINLQGVRDEARKRR